MGFYFFVSEYLQEVFMFSPLWVGIAFFPLTLFTFWGAIEVPRAVRHWGNKKTLFGGFVLMLTGFIGMLYLNTTSSYWLGIGIPMMLIGFGQGLVMSPLTNLGIQEVRPEDSGAASGVVNAAHQIGCSVENRRWCRCGADLHRPDLRGPQAGQSFGAGPAAAPCIKKGATTWRCRTLCA